MLTHLRFFTGGESHGQGGVGILDGMPASVPISLAEINHQLHRRQQGYGRGGRMRIEQDTAQILSGVRFGMTLGSPISLFIENRDFKNWRDRMAVDGPNTESKPVTVPRPGHADLAGAIKYQQADIRNILERASARETAMRVGLGALARQFLAHLGITIASHVLQIADARSPVTFLDAGKPDFDLDPATVNTTADASPVRCLEAEAATAMMARIDQAKKQRDTVGGIFEVVAFGVPVGLGSYVQWDRRLDARLATAMMSIPAMKAVEIGDGWAAAGRFGSQVHDQIYYDSEKSQFSRDRNNAGGLEGGISNGMPLVVRVAMKPIATLMQPLDSVDLHSKKPVAAHRERSDVCAVPAASVIGEAMLALVLADAVLEKFGGDSLEEVRQRLVAWRETS